MQQWEHRHVIFSNGGMTDNGVAQLTPPDMDVFVQQVGDDGWEMVSMAVLGSSDHHFAFKRPKQEETGEGAAGAVTGIAAGLRERVVQARDAVMERLNRTGDKEGDGNERSLSDSTEPTEHIADDSNRPETINEAGRGAGAIPAGVAAQPDFFTHPTSTGSPDIVETIGEYAENADTLDAKDIAANTAKSGNTE